MNYLGHSWVALKATNRQDSLLIAGSHLPDLVPFVPNSIFTFEQIHESGDLLLDFLRKNHPDKTSLALGIVSHSVRYGADKFNPEIEKLLNLDENSAEDLAQLISKASAVSYEIARGARMHNFLWTGIEMYLSKNQQFTHDLEQLNQEINYREVSQLLSGFFHLDEPLVYQEIESFFRKTTKVAKDQFELANQWRDIAVGLPEGDNVDVDKTATLIAYIYDKFANQWEGLLNQVTSTVKRNMEQFLSSRVQGPSG